MLIIGNGESRSIIDIDSIKDKKVGCNAIFRDYHVDHLVCVDRRMIDEALQVNANHHSYVYTRKDWFASYNNTYKKIRLVPDLPYVGSERPDDPWHWGSGPYAVLLGAKLSQTNEVKLVGFDLHSKTGYVNNIYKDTINYDIAGKKAVDPRYWIYQIAKVFYHNPNVTFTIYQDNDWEMPKTWKYHNVKVDNIELLR